MKITVLSDQVQVENYVAKLLLAQVKTNAESILGLATGGTMVPIYHQLIQQSQQQQVDFSQVTTINLDEYVGLAAADKQSYHYYMKHLLFNKLQITNYHLPKGGALDLQEQCNNYETLIKSLGGIDLQLLGIGENGHIAFNEPGTSFDSLTHIVDLSSSTIKANSRFFDGQLDKVPTQAITMGIKTILSAKKIILVAVGVNKSKIMEQLLQLQEPSESIPASSLLNHKNVEIVMDEAAAGK